MEADQTSRVLSIGARLAAEAGRIGAVADGEHRRIENLVAVNVGDRHLSGRNQVVIAIGELEQVLFEFRELPGRSQRFGIDDVGRHDFGVTALAVCVEHEINEGAIQPRAGAGDQRKPRAGDLRRAIEIEDAQGLAEVPVRLRLEIEAGLLTPRALHAIGAFIPTLGDAVMRYVRKVELEVLQIVFDARQNRVELLDLIAEALHGFDLRAGVLLVFLEGCDFLRCLVALILQGLDARDGAPPLGVKIEESIEVDLHAALLERGAVFVRMIAKVFARQHGAK